MPQIVQTNISSINTQRNLNVSQNSLATSLQRLSTGFRINSAKDDAAGLAISERMTAQIRGLDQAVRNANDGVSLSQTAEAGLSTVGESLLRIRELAIQSANATNSSSDRAALQAEVNQRLQELSRVNSDTEFNGLKLFDGSFTNQTFQVGANANQTINVNMQEVSGSTIGAFKTTLLNTTVNEGTGSALVAQAGPLAVTTDNAITAQDLTLSGSAFTGTEVVSISDGATAKDIAAAINASSDTTSISATANTVVTLSGLSADGTVSLNLGEGESGSLVNISGAVTQGDLSALAADINAKSGNTGITAVLNADGDAIVLESDDGDNIVISEFNHTSAGATIATEYADGNADTLTQGGNNSTVVAGTVNLVSHETFNIQTTDDNTAGGVLDVASDTDVTSVLDDVAGVDVSSQVGAQDAIDVIDGALDIINAIRGDLGAIQNRFEAAIVNMQSVSENLSAAKSRIKDADFAKETAELSRSQILQQAGVSILGQANALPQNALSLLQ